MQSRLHTRKFRSVVTSLFAFCVLFLGSNASFSAEPGIQNSYTFKIDGKDLVLEVDRTQYFYIPAGGIGELRNTGLLPSAEAVRQAAAKTEQAGGESRLIMYEAGQPRVKANRYDLTRDIMARLGGELNGAAIAAEFGLNYRGELGYYRGIHVFRAQSVGQTLLVLNTIAAKPGISEVQPVFARFPVRHHFPNDPLFTNQWHLLSTGQNGASLDADVNITNVWERYRGSNVVLAVFDDGFDLTHPDLVDNFLTNLAFNPQDGSQNVGVRPGVQDFHGTAVTGVAAARGDNNEGVTGSAPNASIVPIRYDFENGMTFLQEASGLLHSNNLVHVHNNSWGFRFIERNIVGIPTVLSNAFASGVTFGRGGLGTIWVFSAGNDGDVGADVNYSGLTKAMETVTVNALNDLGQRAYYSTYGAASVISAPAGREFSRPVGNRSQGTSTTDVQGTNGYNPSGAAGLPFGDYTNQNYTLGFNGTSSAAPLVSGIIALMLDANPRLGWRDVQEILIRTAALTDTNHIDWITNAAGFHFNHELGAGLIDADAATTLAEGWTNLPTRTNVTIINTNMNLVIPDVDPTGITFTIPVEEDNFRLEHVELKTDITILARGDLQITLTSPSGTSSTLARTRSSDLNADYRDWTFMTVRNWGELAKGDWTVRFTDNQQIGSVGVVNTVELYLHGTHTNSSLIGLTNPPVILQSPLSKAATKNSSTFFHVDAIGTPPLAYRWFRNGIELSGQNQSSLFLHNVSKAEEGIYTVRVFNQFGNAASAGGALFVSAPPEITTQPISLTNTFGSSASFNVAAIGNSPLSYQWRFNGVVLPNETAATLTLNNIQTNHLGVYDVIVRNPISSIISIPAMLSATNLVSSFTFGGFVPASTGGGSFGFNVNGGVGQQIRIDATTDFVNWTPVATNTLIGGSAAFSDGFAFTYSNRYYRVVPLP